MRTAPTNEEAALERTRGVIASSTYLAGVERERHPSAEPQDLEDLGEVEEGDGEGGLDNQFFEALSRLEHPIAPTPANLQHMSAKVEEGELEIEPTQVAKLNAMEAEWLSGEEDIDEDKLERPPLRASRDWKEERRCADTYGVGYKLLNRMGWKTETELSLPCQRHQGDRSGIGMHARVNVLDASLDQKLQQVHNDKAGHVGKLRTYRRLRMLEGFPWSKTTKDLQDKVCEWVNGCMTCQKVWKIRGQQLGPSGAVMRQRPFTEVSIDIVSVKTEDRDGHRYILNVLDSFSRFSELFPLRTGDAESVAECIFSVYNRYGQPIRIRADGAKA
jgi:hypothetical protein